jgi:DNA-directed RNA polymerase specialized sigma24 family protein
MPRRSIPAEIRASLVAPLGRLAGLDPFEAITTANDAHEALLAAHAEIAAIRRRAVRELRAQGYTLREIADAVGVKPQRIHQIESGYDRREKEARKQPRRH